MSDVSDPNPPGGVTGPQPTTPSETGVGGDEASPGNLTTQIDIPWNLPVSQMHDFLLKNYGPQIADLWDKNLNMMIYQILQDMQQHAAASLARQKEMKND